MFTFSFGSAFALAPDYSWSGSDMAGLTSAQNEAVAYINSTDVSVYDGAIKLTVQALMAEYVAKVQAAEKVTDVLELVAEFDEEIAKESKTVALYAAKKAAMTQIKDLALIYTALGVTDATKNAKIWAANGFAGGLGNVIPEFEAEKQNITVEYKPAELLSVAYNAINTATSKEEITSLMNKYLAVLDAVVLAQKNISVTAADIDALVLAIRAEAGQEKNVVKLETHSAAVVSEYNALIETAVAAAKACQTKRDLAYVYYDYLGKVYKDGNWNSNAETQAKTNGNGVLMTTVAKNQSVFATLAGKTKDVEKKLEFVKAVEAKLVAYDYKAFDKDTWAEVEALWDEIAYFEEENAFNTDTTGLAKKLAEDADEYVAATTSEKQTLVKNFVAEYNKKTMLGIAKAAAVASITNYYGETLADVVVKDLTDYSPSNQSLLTALQAAGIAAVDAATTTAAVKAAKADTFDKIDAIETEDEAGFKTKVAKFNADLDKYVAEEKAALKNAKVPTYDADVAVIDTLAAQIKANYLDAEKPDTFAENYVLGGEVTISTVFEFDPTTGLAKPTVEKAEALGYSIDASEWKDLNGNAIVNAPTMTGTYSEAAKAKYDIELAIYQNYLLVNSKAQTVAAVSTGSWEILFQQYAANAADVEKIEPSYVTAYNYYVGLANAAVAKIPATAELTYAYKTALDAAAGAVGTAEGIYKNIVGEELESWVTEASFDGYYDAQYAYDRLVHLKDNGNTAETGAYVIAFNTIANNFLTGTDDVAYAVISSADKAASNVIIQETVAAIAAGTTTAAKEAAAKEGIAKLQKFEEAYDFTNDYANTADMLAEAKAYFNKYYAVAFNSEAKFFFPLAQDVAKFQNQLLGANDVEALVAALQLTARSEITAKGNVKVTINGDVSALTNLGYKVSYKFYKSNKKASGYKATLTKTENVYTNTKLAKGKNYYKAKVVVKDAAGAVVGTTALTQCRYAVRTIK